MISAAELDAARQLVLVLSFVLAMGFGALAQRSHFCTMGAVADVVSMGDWTRARMVVLALAVAIAGFQGLAYIGQIDPAGSMHTSPRVPWLSLIVGGLMFGVGMVLASGCGAKTLVRIGGGNLKSLVVWIVMGVAAQATLRGVSAVARHDWLDPQSVQLASRQDLPALLARWFGTTSATLSLALGLGVALLLVAWTLRGHKAPWREWLPAGLGVGLLLSTAWWVSGHLGFVAEHPDTLEPAYLGSGGRGMEAWSFVGPAAYLLDWLTYFSDAQQRLSVGVVLPLGVVAGAALAALRGGAFRWEGFADAGDLGRHLLGAVLMGVGGVTALGCSIGQGLSGLSTLSLGSALATLAIISGAVAALRWQMARLERLA